MNSTRHCRRRVSTRMTRSPRGSMLRTEKRGLQVSAGVKGWLRKRQTRLWRASRMVWRCSQTRGKCARQACRSLMCPGFTESSFQHGK